MEHEPQEDETLAGFIESFDPALTSWARRITSTDDIRMALAYGAMSAIWEVAQIADRYEEDPHLDRVLMIWMARYRALARRRNAVRFPLILEAARVMSDERLEEPQHNQSVDPYDRPQGGPPRA